MDDSLLIFKNSNISINHVHQYTQKPYQVYCGRANSYYGLNESILANPYPLLKERERDVICDQYERYFDQRIMANDSVFMGELARLLNLHKVYGKLELVCWCKPKRCHCETIKRYLENKYE